MDSLMSLWDWLLSQVNPLSVIAALLTIWLAIWGLFKWLGGKKAESSVNNEGGIYSAGKLSIGKNAHVNTGLQINTPPPPSSQSDSSKS